jgi:hypothetical protein
MILMQGAAEKDAGASVVALRDKLEGRSQVV